MARCYAKGLWNSFFFFYFCLSVKNLRVRLSNENLKIIPISEKNTRKQDKLLIKQTQISKRLLILEKLTKTKLKNKNCDLSLKYSIMKSFFF